MLIHAQTETAVANEALSHLKQPELVDVIADTTNSARKVRKHFASVRDALLRRYPWNFAKTRVQLAAQLAAPAFGYKFQYAMPNDCLAVREVVSILSDGSVVSGMSSQDAWKIEQRSILSDLPSPLNVIYTRLAHEVALWDPLFRQAFGLLLAAAVGPELSADEVRIKQCAEKAAELLEDAFTSDAAEGTPDDVAQGDWLDARFGGAMPDYWRT